MFILERIKSLNSEIECYRSKQREYIDHMAEFPVSEVIKIHKAKLGRRGVWRSFKEKIA